MPESTAAYGHDHAPLVAEGSKCPTCDRRVPYKKKATSPDTKVYSLRIPVSNVDNFKEMLEAASAHLGLAEKPHSPYWTLVHGLVQILQGPAGGEEEQAVDPCIVCGSPAVHTHHRKRRSQGGSDGPENLVRLCFGCHDEVHRNPAAAMLAGLLVRSTDDPATALCRPDRFKELLAG